MALYAGSTRIDKLGGITSCTSALQLFSYPVQHLSLSACVASHFSLHYSFLGCRKRQSTITTELIEIIAGASALMDS